MKHLIILVMHWSKIIAHGLTQVEKIKHIKIHDVCASVSGHMPLPIVISYMAHISAQHDV